MKVEKERGQKPLYVYNQKFNITLAINEISIRFACRSSNTVVACPLQSVIVSFLKNRCRNDEARYFLGNKWRRLFFGRKNSDLMRISFAILFVCDGIVKKKKKKNRLVLF
jgi:hypothetical protein